MEIKTENKKKEKIKLKKGEEELIRSAYYKHNEEEIWDDFKTFIETTINFDEANFNKANFNKDITDENDTIKLHSKLYSIYSFIVDRFSDGKSVIEFMIKMFGIVEENSKDRLLEEIFLEFESNKKDNQKYIKAINVGMTSNNIIANFVAKQFICENINLKRANTLLGYSSKKIEDLFFTNYVLNHKELHRTLFEKIKDIDGVNLEYIKEIFFKMDFVNDKLNSISSKIGTNDISVNIFKELLLCMGICNKQINLEKENPEKVKDYNGLITKIYNILENFFDKYIQLKSEEDLDELFKNDEINITILDKLFECIEKEKNNTIKDIKIFEYKTICKIIEKIKNKNDIKYFISLYKKYNLNLNKDILKYFFERKKFEYLQILLNDNDIVQKLNENDIKDLFICACKNINNPNLDQTIRFLFNRFPKEISEIDVNDLFKKVNYQKDKTLLDYLIGNNKDQINGKLIRILIGKLNSENIDLMSQENKIKASYFAILYFDDVNIFKRYYNSVLESSKDSYYIESYNNKCIKQFYTRGKINIVKALDFMKINEKNFSNLLNEELIKIDIVDLKLLNNILLKYFNLNSNIEDNFKYPPEIVVQGLKVEGQGSNQILVNKREIKYDKTRTPWVILEINDEIFSNLNNKKNGLLYKVIYKNDNTQKITYYDKEGSLLAIAKINDKEELEFEQEFENKEASYDLDEIKHILNDDYVSIDQFDHKLSFLTYALLSNRKNIIFKTNCKTADEIANVIEKSQNNEEKAKTFICDYFVDDEHDVQVFVKNGCIDILNCLFYGHQEINDEIKNECEKRQLQNTEINQISFISQQPSNCVEASKLFATVLAKEYSECYGGLDDFSEKLNRFKEFMEKVIINAKPEEQIDYVKESYKNEKFKKENIEMLRIVLKTSNELLEEYKTHFVMPISYIGLFCKTIRKIDNVFDDEMKEIYNIFSIINSRNAISMLLNQKDKNDKYKQFIGDIIRFNKINFSEKEKDENLVNKLDKIEKLLEFMKDGIMTKLDNFNERQKEIFKNIDDKISSGRENVLEECLKEFDKLQTNEIDFK